MKKIFMAGVLAGVLGFGFAAHAEVGCMYDSQHDVVVYNTSKRATSLTNIATLDFYKTVTNANESYYHATVRLTGINEKTKSEPFAMLIVDNKMYKVFPTPFKKFDITNGRETYMLVLDYEIPADLIAKASAYKSQIGLQIFVDGEKSRILTLGAEGNKELKLISKLKYADYDAVKSGKIVPEPVAE